MKKKRAAKVLALALLLGLCLWLTGCYIPPDQITDDAQNMTIGANNLPFNTLAPTEAPATATPTPNPVVSNTDGIDIGSNTGQRAHGHRGLERGPGVPPRTARIRRPIVLPALR